ncbi:MAG: FeoB-associated Cys-rich membrane protein [Nitrospiraceae bacterium]|nr:MAG: FeoB-associated Cys-rich membrane protein [Nitrospiraceae bacterium]
MGIADVLIMILIIGGAVYMLYRSLWKKKGHCQGCDSVACEKKQL